jgi:hypothetical protein
MTRHHRHGKAKRLDSAPLQALFDEVMGVDAMSAEADADVIDLTGDDATREVVIPEVIDVTDSSSPRGRHLELLPSGYDDRYTNGVEIVDERAASSHPSQERAEMPKQSRALRITTVKSNGRRRWAVDFLVREPDADDGSK